MKLQKCKNKAIMAIVFIALIATLSVCLFHIKPDWKYMFAQVAANNLRRDVVLEKKKINQTEIPVSQLKENSDIIYNQSMMLINKENPLDNDYEADITEYNTKGLEMNRCITKDFKQLSDAVFKNCSEYLYVMSSYRTANDQAAIYAEQGSEVAERPGSSEHQTGLALDVYVNGFAGSGFLKSEAGRYVNSHCWEYGFIIRYPLLKSSVTGIDYEPWHLRYVGLPHSEIISQNGIAFEEYIDLFEYGEFYQYNNYLISRQRGDVLKVPVEFEECIVSDDNCGGYFITAKIKKL